MRLRRFILARTMAALLTLFAASITGAQSGIPYLPSQPSCPIDHFCVTPKPLYSPYSPTVPSEVSFDELSRIQKEWRRNQDVAYTPRSVRSDSDENELKPHASPDAPDQSELLKNARDPEFILRNFRTMYLETHNIKFFDKDQMRAALMGNPEFRKLKINIVDDPRVADTVLVVSYTFAWDYPFELRHQNTTDVLLGGKGEGPLSGPLGAWDVARVFVNMAKPWRTDHK